MCESDTTCESWVAPAHVGLSVVVKDTACIAVAVAQDVAAVAFSYDCVNTNMT